MADAGNNRNNRTNRNRTRRVRFPNTLPIHKLTPEEHQYIQVIKAEYNDPAIQHEYANSLNVSNNSKKRIKIALASFNNPANINQNRTRNLRNSRKSIVESMNRGNYPLLHYLRARHATVPNMQAELNTLALSQPKKNAIMRRLKESVGRQHFGVRNSHILAKAMASSNDPVEIIDYISKLDDVPISTQNRLIAQVFYFLEEGMTPQEANAFRQKVANSSKPFPITSAVLANSGALE